MAQKIKTVYCYGDSWTWGADLEDRTQSWPHVLGELLDVTVVNRGIPGNNNRNISLSVLADAHLHSAETWVCVLWSTPYRFGVSAGDLITEDNNFYLSTQAVDNSDPALFHEVLVGLEMTASVATVRSSVKPSRLTQSSAWHNFEEEFESVIGGDWIHPEGVAGYLNIDYRKHPDEAQHQQIAHLFHKNISKRIT